MVNFKEEAHLKTLMQVTAQANKKVVMVKDCAREADKILVNGVELTCDTTIEGYVNSTGNGMVISVDNANIIYMEYLKYFVEFKATLEKMNELCTELQKSVGVDGTGAPVITSPSLVASATALASTIQPLIDKLP